MKTKRCFNRHRVDTPGCEGCHYTFHVTAPGKVEGGRLVPPQVEGPEACELCHDARHAQPVKGCDRCIGRIGDQIITMERGIGEPLRRDIEHMKLARLLLSWRTTAIGVLGLVSGRAAGFWFEGEDWIYYTLIAPFAQFLLKREIEKAEARLPRYGPGGEILLGEQDPSRPRNS